VTAWISAGSATSGRCEIALLRGGNQVGHAEKQIQMREGITEAEFEFPIDNPALWSPDEPNLYALNAALHTDSGIDRWSCRTGFRDTGIRGRGFLLNGEPILLNGICRHDIWKDQGFTLTRAQMEQDMRGIKAMGANFIRLVHYPHDRYIIDLADELGLLVSEEPGYWNVDFRKMPWSQAELGLRIMERAARRDWNSPSIFA
jgi:beta-galactosidase